VVGHAGAHASDHLVLAGAAQRLAERRAAGRIIGFWAAPQNWQ
jgi:hypothetical protein